MTIDTHLHILPDFFWRATENAHDSVGGKLALVLLSMALAQAPTGAVAPVGAVVFSPITDLALTEESVEAKPDLWMGMLHGFVANVGGFIAATQALKARGAFLTERIGSTA